MTDETQRGFWRKYYGNLAHKGVERLDYSNDQVHLQAFGLALQAGGPVAGRRVLDFGCANGHLAGCLHQLGAGEVTSVDITPELSEANCKRLPQVRWECIELLNPTFAESMREQDLAYALEVLQCMPKKGTLNALWEVATSSGRLVATAPNPQCPLAQKAKARFSEGIYNRWE